MYIGDLLKHDTVLSAFDEGAHADSVGGENDLFACT